MGNIFQSLRIAERDRENRKIPFPKFLDIAFPNSYNATQTSLRNLSRQPIVVFEGKHYLGDEL
jgi:hypothetical protein